MSEEQVVCPFCPLHCDDLSASQLSDGKTDCSVANAAASAIKGWQPSPATLDLLNECRRWVAEADRITISGTVIDLDTSRAVTDFVRVTGADIAVHESNPSAAKQFSRDGGFFATLGEIATHDTSVLIIGDATTQWPRIDSRLRGALKIARLEESERLADRLANLRLLVSGRYAEPTIADEEESKLIQFIRNSSYLIILVAPLEENARDSMAIWSAIFGLVRERNKTSRASIISLNPAITLRHTMAARLDPKPFSFPISGNELQIVFVPWGQQTRPNPAEHNRTIFIGMAELPLHGAGKNTVNLPAQVPGIHHPGVVIRGDGSVTLPLQQWGTLPGWLEGLPKPGDVLRQLLQPSS